MSQNNNFEYDIDFDHLDSEEDVEVERIGTHHQNKIKQLKAQQKQQKSQQQQQQQQAKAARHTSQQQQQQHKSQPGNPLSTTSSLRKIDDAFKSTAQQQLAQRAAAAATSGTASDYDLDAQLKLVAGDDDGDSDATKKLMASLLQGNGDDDYDNDDDENGGEIVDINAILGLAPAQSKHQQAQHFEVPTFAATTDDNDEQQPHQGGVKLEVDSASTLASSPAEKNTRENPTSGAAVVTKSRGLFGQVKKEQDASHQQQQQQQQNELASPSLISVTSSAGATAASRSKQNFTVADAPEMKFASGEMNISDSNSGNRFSDAAMQVKYEVVKMEDIVAADALQQDVAASSSSSTQSSSSSTAQAKKLPPEISAQERQSNVPTTEQLLASNAPMILRNVYWFDAKEAQSHDCADRPDLAGQVLLFGRIAVRESVHSATATFKSICVRVPMKRTVLFLPKKRAPTSSSSANTTTSTTAANNHQELTQDQKNTALLEVHSLCRSKGDLRDKTFKWVKRRYAFEEAGVPTEETEWLKLKYSAANAPLWRADDNTPKFDNFSHVFGVNRSLMELLFIESRFEGPGFLDITNATAIPPTSKQRCSICAFEFVARSQEDVFVLTNTSVRGVPAPPKLTAASLCLRTQLDPSGQKHEIYAATLATCVFDTEAATPKAPDCYSHTGVRQWSSKHDDKLPFDLIKQGITNHLGSIKTFADERDLLKWLLQLIRDTDPDTIIGHNIVGFSLGLLFSRIDELQIPRQMPEWSSLGRMHWKSVPHQLGARKGSQQSQSNTGYWEKEMCSGRLLVDTYNLAREYHKTNNYKLLSLASELQLSGVFGPVLESHVEQQVEILNSHKMRNADELIKILGQDCNFALLCVRLTHKLGLIPLTKRLTNVAGTVWSRVLNGARSERIEYLLMHAFHRLKFITPDKSGYKQRLALQLQAAALEKQEQEQLVQNKENAGGAKKTAGAGAGAVRRQRGGGASGNNLNATAALVAAAAAEAFGDGGDNDDDADAAAAVDVDGLAIDEDEDALQDDIAANGGGGGADAGHTNAASALAGKKTAKYKGGRVLEPDVGLYRDYVLLLDFNSLYPSLIQEFNVCFTTVERQKGAAALRDRAEPQIPQRDSLICETCAKLPNAQDLYPCPHRCILPKVIRQLVDGRKQVRQLMKSERNPATLAQLEIRQKALKLTANSMYGCLGFEHSRFYAQKLAELVTLQGRNALTKTVEIVNSAPGNVRVIYGDTDSVMISTKEFENLDNVKRLASAIQREVNKRYRHLELGMDGVFRTLLLHKKKKYAALTVTDWQGAGKEFKQEVKGLEMVRRDWCKLSKQACAMVLKIALDPKLTDAEEVVDTIGAGLEKIADRVLAGLEPLNSYVIAKSIQRAPEAYKDAGSQPHVQVALRMKQRQLHVSVGDLIPYVICGLPGPTAAAAAASEKQDLQQQQQGLDGAANANSPQNVQVAKKAPAVATATQIVKQLAQRAFSEDEVKEQSLAVDAEWYLANQLYPPVLRLCEHIEGFTSEFLCSKLKITKAAVGLSENNNNNNDRNNARADANRPVFAVTFKGMTLEEAYPNVEPFTMTCLKCGEVLKQQPHTRAAEILNKNHPRFGSEFPRPDLLKSKIIAARWFSQNQLDRVPWFYCANATCPDPFFAPAVVENSIIMYLDRAVKSFYSAESARSDAKYKKLLDQVSYIQRLIEIPAIPLGPAEMSLWSRAARFVDVNGKWKSAEEVRKAQRDAHKTYGGDEDWLRKRDETLKSRLVGKEALDRFLPLLPALRIDFGTEFFSE